MNRIKSIWINKKITILEDGNPVINFFNIVFNCCFLWIFLNIVILNKCDLVNYNMLSVFLWAIDLLFLLICVRKKLEKAALFMDRIGIKKYFVLAVIVMIFFIIQLRVGYALETPLSWDAGIVYNDAVSAAATGHVINNSYYLLYPNNLGILLLLSSYFKIIKTLSISKYLYSAIILNIIIMDITIILIYLICEKLFGTKSSVLSLIFSFVFVVLCGWVATPYTDVLSMIFPVLIFYLYLKSKEVKSITQKCFIYVAIGAAGLAAYRLKPTSILILIAIILVMSINNIKQLKKYILSFSLMAAGFIFASAFFNFSIDNSGILNYKLKDSYEYNTPITYFLMLGMQKYDIPERGTLYGAINSKDSIQNKNLKTKSNRIQYDINEIKNRLKGFGTIGYLSFLSDKASWIFSDGTFYLYGEGSFSHFVHTDTISSRIQSLIFINSENYKFYSYFMNSVWIVLLFLILCPLFCKENFNFNQDTLILRITLFGVLIFLLLFEGRPRYLYNNIGIFIITATYGYKILPRKKKVIAEKSET